MRPRGLKSPRGANPEQCSHQNAEIEPARMHEQPLQHVRDRTRASQPTGPRRDAVRVTIESGYNRRGHPIMSTAASSDATLSSALEGFHRGDFSRLERLFDERSSRSGKPQIVEWNEQGRFRDQPKALAEALTCASFLGRTGVAEYLLKQG